MERNVVILETANKLEAAGFPRSVAACLWVENKVNSQWSVLVDGGTNYVGHAAPTAQELADSLPNVRLSNKRGTYTVLVARFSIAMEPLPDYEKTGPTMAEALALMWLKLNGASDD